MDAQDPEQIKADLLHKMRVGHVAWTALFVHARDRINEPGVEGDWSVKDIIAHVATYEDWMAQLLEAGGSNIPHVTDTMTQDETNAWVFEQHRDSSPEEVLALSLASYERLRKAVEALSPEELVATGKFEWAKGKPAYKIIPGDSYNHYYHHSARILDWLERQPESES